MAEAQVAAVYLLWGDEGELLYVGCSARPRQRLSHHRTQQEWGREIAAMDFCMLPAREARELEVSLIGELRPRYNIQANPDACSRSVLGGRTYFHVRLTDEAKRLLKALAMEDGRTLEKELERALRAFSRIPAHLR